MTRATLPAGLHFGLDDATYHSDPAPAPSLSSTLARIILNQSPRHAWHASPRLNPAHQSRHSDAFDIGKAFHTLLLGRGAGVHVVDAEDWRGKDARAERDAARAAGKVPLLRDQHDAACVMLDSARAKLAALRIRLDPARAEVAALAQIDGVWCRALVDYAPADARLPLLDVKTCDDASPEACVRAVTSYGYDVQASHYLDVWKAATGESRRFRFLFVEKQPPHECSVVELCDDEADPADWMLTARAKTAEARRIWGECLAADQWPGYPAQIAVIGAPVWHTTRWADRETGRPIQEKPSPAALEAARAMMAP